MSRTRTQRLREHIIDQIVSGTRDQAKVADAVPAELANLYDAAEGLSAAVNSLWDAAMSEAEEIGDLSPTAQKVSRHVREAGYRASDALSHAAHRVADRVPSDLRNLTPKDPLPYVLAGFGAVLAVALLCGNKRR